MATLRMSAHERERLEVFARVKRRELTVKNAAALLSLSLRQARRVWKRFSTNGASGLLHAGRGRASNNRLCNEVREQALALYRKHYSDFGPTHACEKLQEAGIRISPDSLVNLLKENDLYVRRRRRGRHRSRRERRKCFGELVQADGSVHDWFEGRSDQKPTLMVAVDDATGRTLARFYPDETRAAAMDLFARWCDKHGRPRAWYVDRHTIYRNNERPHLPTQFARAMNDLDVQLICARSPQAKGRVERRHGLFQDRLIKEMRLRNIQDLQQANTLLDQTFLPEINRRYTVKAAHASDVHRPAPSDLSQILCRQEERVVGNDWCLAWDTRVLQIDKRHATLMLPGRRVLVRELTDGKLVVRFQDKPLNVTELTSRPKPPKQKKQPVNNKQYKPKPDHPWVKHPAVHPKRTRPCS